MKVQGLFSFYKGKEIDVSQKVYEIVTKQIIDILENGVVPWHLPWRKNDQPHRNFISNKV
ncbi:ArdC family protein, partial [bacterium]|nr:ArdC family protein [bacterium]